MADSKKEVRVPIGDHQLPGTLTVPESAKGLVIFVHGSGSSRLSPRNVFVANVLNQQGIATLLFDLLTPLEDTDIRARFDIGLLTQRLLAARAWADAQPESASLPVGYFGASTGAAAALRAAVPGSPRVAAVVSRGGRPDLAGEEALIAVRAPTLLVVGGHDEIVIDLNDQACAEMCCQKQLSIVPGATHLFEEPGALEQVAELATDWFLQAFG